MEMEIKQALDAHGKAIDAAIEKFEGQLAEKGKVDDEIRAEVKALSEKFESTITELAQKMEAAGGEPEVLTAGAEFIKSAQFQALAARQVDKARTEVKNTVVADSTTTCPSQRPGVIPGDFAPITIRQRIPVIPVSSNAVNALREASFTNAAAEVAQAAEKPESDIT